MPAIKVKVDPTPQQRAFFNSPARHRCYLGGIGAGKTFAGALEVLRQPDGTQGMIVAPTYPMLKQASLKTFVDIAGPAIVSLNRQDMTCELVNGTEILFRSADKPDRLRGANLGWVWIDEGAYCKRETWDVLIGRLREEPGRSWVTTTPRGMNWLYDVFGAENATDEHALVRASTMENRHLPEHYIENLKARYTHEQALQELHGEFVDVAGAIFQGSWIDEHRVSEAPEDLVRVVIGVDPAGTHRPDSDETGIVVCALGRDEKAYVIEDASGRYSPPEWARAVRNLWDEHKADAVVAEVNYGGDMVKSTLDAYGGHMNVNMVNASRGKSVRAEPLAAPYEQGRICHVGVHDTLERQMTTFDPQDRSAVSPDRMDALVWALTKIILNPRRDTRIIGI